MTAPGKGAPDQTMVFSRGDLTLRLPTHIAEKLASQTGREVRLGIRAEDVDEKRDAGEGEVICGVVNSVLPVGSDQFLGMEFGSEELFFRVGKDLHHRTGDQVALSVDFKRLHVFDKDSGRTLIW